MSLETPTVPVLTRALCGSSSASRHNATQKRSRFLGRLVKFRQMDFEYAVWQMFYLFVSPQKVYRNFSYRKHTKDQWARDDPAFLVLIAFWLCVSSLGFSISLSLGFFGFIKFLLWVICIDCVAVGIVIATIFWLITNKYHLIKPTMGQDVEWGYAFDIHLNAIFPVLMILHFFQLPILNAFILVNGVIGSVIGNTMWLFALSYYIYITFLGYSSLPFLKRTKTMLYPITVVFVLYVASIMFNFNLTQTMCSFYKMRVLHRE